jgi:epoxyqueuosine reductase
MVTSDQIKQWGKEVGFDLVGIAPAAPVEHAAYFHDWIEQGCCADMHYLAQNREKRMDPAKLLPGARTIICTALNYFTPSPPYPADTSRGHIARYAWGRDYHDIIKKMLRQLRKLIAAHSTSPPLMQLCVDTAPLAEKEHAARAGLGWIGKNTLLVHPRFGSWLVLGEIVTDIELACDEPAQNQCGSCRRCLDACPMSAFLHPYQLDARRCISYLTIESREAIPPDLAPRMGSWLFGCDVCQESCPYNTNTAPTSHPCWQHAPFCQNLSLPEVLALDPQKFRTRYAGSAVSRASCQHFQQIALNCQRNMRSSA